MRSQPLHLNASHSSYPIMEFITKYDPSHYAIRNRLRAIAREMPRSDIEPGDYVHVPWIHGEPWCKVQDLYGSIGFRLYGIMTGIYDRPEFRQARRFYVVKSYDMKQILGA